MVLYASNIAPMLKGLCNVMLNSPFRFSFSLSPTPNDYPEWVYFCIYPIHAANIIACVLQTTDTTFSNALLKNHLT